MKRNVNANNKMGKNNNLIIHGSGPTVQPYQKVATIIPENQKIGKYTIKNLIPTPLLQERRTAINKAHAMVWQVQGLERLLEFFNETLGFEC